MPESPTLAPPIERIEHAGKLLACVIRAQVEPSETTFVTPPEFNQQVGFVVYPSGGTVTAHMHKPLERHIVGTAEVLVVRKGRCELDIYNDERRLVATREVSRGDVIILQAGGHGFRMLEDTVFLEVKQGPYTGTDEKECFA